MPIPALSVHGPWCVAASPWQEPRRRAPSVSTTPLQSRQGTHALDACASGSYRAAIFLCVWGPGHHALGMCCENRGFWLRALCGLELAMLAIQQVATNGAPRFMLLRVRQARSQCRHLVFVVFFFPGPLVVCSCNFSGTFLCPVHAGLCFVFFYRSTVTTTALGLRQTARGRVCLMSVARIHKN